MKVFKTTFPIQLPAKNTEPTNVNVFSERDIFIDGDIDVNVLEVDDTSSVTFIPSKVRRLPALTVRRGEILLIDGDAIMSGDITVESGGRMEII